MGVHLDPLVYPLPNIRTKTPCRVGGCEYPTRPTWGFVARGSTTTLPLEVVGHWSKLLKYGNSLPDCATICYFLQNKGVPFIRQYPQQKRCPIYWTLLSRKC